MNYIEKARAYRKHMEATAQYAPDNVALLEPTLYPAWEAGKEYIKEAILRYGDDLYRVVQDHTSQAHWLPGAGTASLYTLIRFNEGGIVVWIKPVGAHNAYKAGAVVSHNGKHWVSEMDGNAWEPGVTGWKEVTA